MTPAPAASVLKALVRTLSGDNALLQLLGRPAVYDEPPRDAPYPRISLTRVLTRDWSTATEPGHEHQIELTVTTRDVGRGVSAVIAAATVAALVDRPWQADGVTIVNVVHTGTASPERKAREVTAVVGLRVVTEPA